MRESDICVVRDIKKGKKEASQGMVGMIRLLETRPCHWVLALSALSITGSPVLWCLTEEREVPP